MKDLSKSSKVVISAPPKKLSDFFISTEQIETLENVWCFNPSTALELLLEADSKRSTDIEVKPISFE